MRAVSLAPSFAAFLVPTRIAIRVANFLANLVAEHGEANDEHTQQGHGTVFLRAPESNTPDLWRFYARLRTTFRS